MTNPHTLPSEWREHAQVLRRYGAGESATALQQCAQELRDAFHDHEMESLTVAQAASEFGYSIGHIRNLLSAQTLPNVGRTNRPLVLRRDMVALRTRVK